MTSQWKRWALELQSSLLTRLQKKLLNKAWLWLGRDSRVLGTSIAVESLSGSQGSQLHSPWPVGQRGSNYSERCSGAVQRSASAKVHEHSKWLPLNSCCHRPSMPGGHQCGCVRVCGQTDHSLCSYNLCAINTALCRFHFPLAMVHIHTTTCRLLTAPCVRLLLCNQSFNHEMDRWEIHWYNFHLQS